MVHSTGSTRLITAPTHHHSPVTQAPHKPLTHQPSPQSPTGTEGTAWVEESAKAPSTMEAEEHPEDAEEGMDTN